MLIRKYAFMSIIGLFIATAFTTNKTLAGDGFENASVTGVQYEYNNTSWAAKNLIDDNVSTRWLSRQQTNDLIMMLSNTGDPACFSGIGLYNGTVNDRNIKRFALLTTSDDSLASDYGTDGWRPIIADANPTYLIDYLSWAQGARIVDISNQHNSTTWAGEHANDGDTRSQWLSLYGYNVLEYNFDTDWNGATGNAITIDEIEVLNYSTDDRSVKEFQIEVTQNGTDWFRLEVPTTAAEDPEYIYSRKIDGGLLGTVDSAYNATSWSGDNINDGFHKTRWLSRKGNNTIEFTFDPDRSGMSGADGDLNDLFDIEKFRIENYENNDDRSIRLFQVAVKTVLNQQWHKIRRPGAIIGETDFNFALLHHGAELTQKEFEYNTTSWAARNIHDGDQNTRWLSRAMANRIAFAFNPEENSASAEVSDQFTLERIHLKNYGTDDRAIKHFQIEVKTAANPDWQALIAPGGAVGQAGFNFALSNNGASLVNPQDNEYNSTSWAAANIHDGTHVTRWLSRKTNNNLEFTFDVDRDGNFGSASDQFTFDRFILQNYGVDDRSIKEFEVQVQTDADANWRSLPVPGASIGDTNFNFALDNNGAEIYNIDGEYNSTSWAAANLHDGDNNTRWLSRKFDNVLDFRFNPNKNATVSDVDDRFEIERLYLRNYGNDDRSIALFQLAYKTLETDDWTYIEVPGSAANEPGYDYGLVAHGANIKSVDSQYNSSSWAAANLIDGRPNTRWLSRKQNNTIEFNFDADLDGTYGDGINIETVGLINYGNDDRSVATFQIELETAPGVWELAKDAATSATTFSAPMSSTQQNYNITPATNITGVRFISLTNHGDPSYTGVGELKFIGNTVGATYSFSASMDSNGQFIELDPANLPSNVGYFRLRTVTNHGDPSYIGAREFQILGKSITETTVFVAAMDGTEQIFTLDANDVPVDVTKVRLKTISNHGDPSYIGAREFQILGDSITRSTIFTAQMIGTGETFELTENGNIENVTGVRLVTINNYGDPSYIGAREFEVLGPSITESFTFTANMQKAPETFLLDADDIPEDVTDVKFITINNYGDPTYIGAREFEVIGKSVTPAHSFYLPQTKGPHRIKLDDEDKVTGITGVKFITINNHGDPSYTGLTEIRLFGTPVTPSYVFNATDQSSTQTFNFDTVSDKYLRLHTMTNHGDNSYIWANELSLVSANCAVGDWHFDETSWNGTANEVIDSSDSGLNGQAQGAATGSPATTASGNNAIVGSPGSCRYGEFDGEDDFVEMDLGSTLVNSKQITVSMWFNADAYVAQGQSRSGLFTFEPQSGGSNLEVSAYFNSSTGKKLNIEFGSQADNFLTTQDFELDTWYHLSIVYNGSLPQAQRIKIYVNGILEGTYSEQDNQFLGDPTLFYVGSLDKSGANLNVFNGSIDEVVIHPFAYSQSKINQLMIRSRPCPVELDHIKITHTGSGVSCAAHSVDLTACANADCSAIYNGNDIDFTLQKQTGSGTTTLGTYTINGVTGTLSNASFNETDIGTFAFTGTTTATPNVKCDNSALGTTSCDYNIASSGFIVTDGDNQNAASCGTNTFTIQAVRSPASPGGGACIAEYANTNKSLTFSYNYVTPDLASVVNPANATIEGQSHTATTTGSAVNVPFDSEGKAQIDVGYAEAGLISVTVNDNNGVLSSTSATLGFVPATLSLDWADGTSNNIAGEAEQVSIVGSCANGTVTQNYIPSGEFEVSAIRVAPTDAEIQSEDASVTPNDLETLLIANKTTVNPNGPAIAVDVSSGNTQVIQVEYSEVASLQLSITDTNYLSQRINSSSALSGQFGISYYSASNNAPSLNGSCNAFTYIGQESDWLVAPEVTLTAKNAKNQTTHFADVLNYWAQNTTTMTSEFANNTYTQNTVVNNSQVVTINDSTTAVETNPSKVDGQRTYQLSGQKVRYNKTRTPDAPFDADLTLDISANAFIDNNGVGIKGDVTDANYLDVSFANISGIELIYGRLNVQSNFGSELDNIPWRGQLEHYAASGQWLLNSDDSCTVATQDSITIDGLSEFVFASSSPKYTLDQSSGTTYLLAPSAPPSVTATGGILELKFNAPGSGNIGGFDIDVDLTSENAFLRWDWDSDGTGAFVDSDNDGIDDWLDLNLPTTTMTFGRFRGNDRIIYKRER
jgi:MSHA biogenesis protein MshQ